MDDREGPIRLGIRPCDCSASTGAENGASYSRTWLGSLWACSPVVMRISIQTPCSIGELIDKITILRIKAERIADPGKLDNVRRELALLESLQQKEGLKGAALEAIAGNLAAVNVRLWEIEEALRICENDRDFGLRFVALARSVYAANDERAALKRAVNSLYRSALVEEKSYV